MSFLLLCAFASDDNSLNYAAILETAADVAKAMMHLHSYGVRGGGAAHGLLVAQWSC